MTKQALFLVRLRVHIRHRVAGVTDGERLLDEDERLAIVATMDELRALAGGDDAHAIEQQAKRLSQITDAFAARRMDATVKAALSGRRLNEIEDN